MRSQCHSVVTSKDLGFASDKNIWYLYPKYISDGNTLWSFLNAKQGYSRETSGCPWDYISRPMRSKGTNQKPKKRQIQKAWMPVAFQLDIHASKYIHIFPLVPASLVWPNQLACQLGRQMWGNSPHSWSAMPDSGCLVYIVYCRPVYFCTSSSAAICLYITLHFCKMQF